MPSQSHPQAQFVPIPPDLDLDTLVENTENFKYVTKIPHEILKEHTAQSLEQLVLLYVVKGGQPLVIEGWNHSELPSWLFSAEWLQQNLGSRPESVRDLSTATDIPMTMGHYLRSMDKLTSQITPVNYRDPQRQRLYLKDADTPEEWAEHLKDVLPESIFYLNDCIESRTGGDGSIREPNEYGQMRFGRGAAPAGDLMSSLPQQMQALNMMCYIGHEGTYTPAHREMCASLGQNIMVETSTKKRGENPGSSVWFMTETKEREVVSEYFLSMLGHDIEVERHFAQINAWKKAPFTVWIVEQNLGDLILIPPLAPHQVWNRGTRTMKAAWNRTTIDTLELAIHEALPRARMVCRDEQYKNKAIIYYTLIKYFGILQRDTIEPKMWKYGRIKQLIDDFGRLFALYSEVILSEMFSTLLPTPKAVEFLPFDSNVTCSYCRCNIFNRFLTCKSCVEIAPTGEEDTYDICMECYVMGRSCACISNLTWVEQWKWSELAGNYEDWRGIVVQANGYYDVNTSPPPLEILKERYGMKTAAEICQGQLKSRPWHDITKIILPEPLPGDSDVEPEVDDEGRPKKKTPAKRWKNKVTPVKNKTHACHICAHHDHNWKLAFCTTCPSAYCYGVLWRAFDLMPQEVMQSANWECPKCLKICSCGKCRKNPTQTPYAPKGTLLGHDTRKVADFRSVESLVDFSKPNLGWLRDEDSNPKDSVRMKKLKERAAAEKARAHTVDERLFVNRGDHLRLQHEAPLDDLSRDTQQLEDIDPMLRQLDSPMTSPRIGNGEYPNTHASTASPANNEFTLLHEADEDFQGYQGDELDAHDQSREHPDRHRMVAPMTNIHTPSFPDPESRYFGNSRMMGIGYYQQSNGVDKILYDDPSAVEAAEVNPPILATQNPNMAFSDLLDPRLQSADARKRKRDDEGGDKSEEEFFSSKKQRKLATAKKARKDDSLANGVGRKGPGRPPRRTAERIHSYVDPNEDIDVAPGQEPEAPSAPVPAVDGSNGDDFDHVALAAQAMSRFRETPGKEKRSARTTPRNRSLPADSPQSPAAKSSSLKRGRRSGRPSMNNALESGVGNPENLPNAKFQKPRVSSASARKVAERIDMDVTSDQSHDETNRDGLERSPKKNNAKGFTESAKNVQEAKMKWRASGKVPGVEVGEIDQQATNKEQAEFTPRKRGRPRKHPLPSAQSGSRQFAFSSQSKSSTVSKLLSLQDRLALAGKSFKIVSKSQKPQDASPALVSGNSAISLRSPSMNLGIRKTPSVTVKSAREASVVNLPKVTGDSVSQVDIGSGDAISPPGGNPGNLNGMAASVSPIEQVRKGPTVVRLLSPSAEPDSVQSDESISEASSSDDDDSTIPAVKTRPTRGGISLRGRGVSNVSNPRDGRGRGRPRRAYSD